MSHAMVVDVVAEFNNYMKRLKENNNKLLRNTNKELEKLNKIYGKLLVEHFREELEEISRLMDVENGLEAFNCINKLKSKAIKLNILKNNESLKEKNNKIYLNNIDNLKNELELILDEKEHKYFKKDFENLEQLKKSVDSIKSEDELNKKLGEIKESFNLSLNKYDKVLEYMNMIQEVGYKIDEFSFDENKREFFVYASNKNKTFDCATKNDKLRLHFDGFKGDQCLEETKKIKELAEKYYNLQFNIEEYEGLPKDEDKMYVNKGRGNQ